MANGTQHHPGKSNKDKKPAQPSKVTTPPPAPEKRTERHGDQPVQVPDRGGPQHLPEGDREYQFDTTPRDAQATGDDAGDDEPASDRDSRETDRGVSMSREHRSADRNPRGADPQQERTIAREPNGRTTR